MIRATLLHYANSSPPLLQREKFYALKDALLERHAMVEGEEVQRIVDQCWGYGDDLDGCPGASCMKCGGTGVYRETFVLLRRYRWGPYVFHRPLERRHVSCFGLWPTISGRIQHAQYGRASVEALLWLYLLSGEWRLLAHALRAWSTADGWHLWPLVNVQRAVFRASMYFHWQHCVLCSRSFWTRGRGWVFCRRCMARSRTVLPDLPF